MALPSNMEAQMTCRGCLEEKGNNNIPFHSLELKFARDLFTSCTGITIEEESCLPSQLCSLCFEKCDKWDEFRRLCYKNDCKMKMHPEKYGQAVPGGAADDVNICWLKQEPDAEYDFGIEDLINPNLDDDASSIDCKNEEEDDDGSYAPGNEDMEELTNEEERDEEENVKADIKAKKKLSVTKSSEPRKSKTNGYHICEECNASFKYLKTYHKHLSKHEAGLIRKKRVKKELPVIDRPIKAPKINRPPKAKEVFICEECGSGHPNLLAFKKHKFSHEIGLTKRIKHVSQLDEHATNPEQVLLTQCWTSQRRKNLKRTGQPYIDRSGNLVVRQLKPGCPATCQRKCNEKIPPEVRQRIFDDFGRLGVFVDQKKFIMDRVSTQPVASRRPRALYSGPSPYRKCFSFVYTLEGKQVCQRFFTTTLAISWHTIKRCVSKKMANEEDWQDGRGKWR